MKLHIAVLLASSTLLLAGCFEPEPEETKPEDAQALVDSMVFVKSKQGLCFGVSTTSRFNTGGVASYSNQVVWVPCDAMPAPTGVQK